EDDNIDLCEPTTKTTFASTKQNSRAVSKGYFLLATALTDLRHKRCDPGPLRHTIHRLERLVMSTSPVSRPENQHAGLRQTQRECERSDRVRLTRLPRNASDGTTNPARIFTVSTLR